VIVAISHASDDHAGPVLEALGRRGAPATLLDLADFPARSAVALEYGGHGPREWTLEGPGGPISAAEVTAVWWRRPRPLAADAALSAADGEFAIRQASEALCGLAASLPARWVNDPWRSGAAAHKPRQLAAAERAGLVVPPTLVTNDPAKARAFLDRPGGAAVVHKPLHATPGDWRPTRLVGPADREDLPSVRFAPVILQEYVPGVDVRVTAVGGRLFAAAVDARRTASPEDFRPVFDEAHVEPCGLPDALAARLRSLLAELGLAFAAIDLRRRDDGEHLFLEVNPEGQWLALEARTGQPITDAVAALLAGA
jgi:glutathione synthase/RimK-type ligase-like ATP-grasp enzyme